MLCCHQSFKDAFLNLVEGKVSKQTYKVVSKIEEFVCFMYRTMLSTNSYLEYSWASAYGLHYTP